MSRLLGFAMAVVALLTLTSSDLQAQKKGNKNLVDKATPEEMKQLQKVKELTGMLAFAESGSSLITLRLEIPHMEPNPNFNKGGGGKGGNNNQQMQNLYRQQQELARITNPVERQRRMAQLMQQMQKQQYQQMQAAKGGNGGNGPFRMVMEKKDFDLEVSEKVVIRKMSLGTEFDDKGFVKEYTKEELAKLRGKDTSKPGYEAKFSELATGQNVRLVLAPATRPAKKDEDGKAAPAGPIVTMIVILQEANAPIAAPKKKNK